MEFGDSSLRLNDVRSCLLVDFLLPRSLLETHFLKLKTNNSEPQTPNLAIGLDEQEHDGLLRVQAILGLIVDN